MKVYIAFSIHGTNAFIVATKTLKTVGSIEELGPEFTAVNSRRPDYKPEDGIKLNWSRLNTVKSGKPLSHPAFVASRFKELEKDGWTVDREKFNDYHFARQRRIAAKQKLP